jgi:hypothetical protein
MSDIKVSIDPDQIKTLVQEAILLQLTTEKREELIKQAIQALLAPVKDKYSHSYDKSPLQQAFQEASYSCARDIVREEFTKPETRAVVAKVVSDGLIKALTDPTKYDELTNNVADIIVKALTPKKDY